VTNTQDRLAAALADRYTIERALGQGGMATVYLAADLKHDRKVAIKVLKPELAAVLGAERFVQEIKTTAALTHPHILPLFDSGDADGFLYYVMPYIEGETIRDRLSRDTQLGVDEAVRIAREIADALDYAHRRGIIHRDIKPENILLHDGRAMVMDFGIALAVSAAAGGRMTETGLSLGTPHYMSPEQATAEKDISARSDVYSLASVLYEMLAGQPPHLGGSAQQIIMKIIAEPSEAVTRYRKSVPPNVSAAVATALEKLPADRFATANAFADALRSTTYARAGDQALATGARGADWRAKAAVPALALSAVLLAIVAWGATQGSTPARVARYDVSLAGPARGAYADRVQIAPDGSRIVMIRQVEGRSSLFVRSPDQLEPVELLGTEGALNPTFSPDGGKIAYMSGPTIRVFDIAGGLSTLLTDSLVGLPGLAWGSDGYVYYDHRGVGPLLRVPEMGGSPEVVSTVDSTANELQHLWPDPLPNGKGVLMVINRGGPGRGASENDGIAVLDLKTGKHKELFRGIAVRYASSGHLLYVTHDRELMAVAFDQDRLAVTGTSVIIAKGILVSGTGSGAVDLSISRAGTLWYALGDRGTSLTEVVWATRDGTTSALRPELRGSVEDVAISPDATRLAYILRVDDGAHVRVQHLATGNRERLTFEPSFEQIAWNPDGRTLIGSPSSGALYRVMADGSADPTPLHGQTIRAFDAQWTPDGTTLLYALRTESYNDIFNFSPERDSAPAVLLRTPGNERSPSVSPDGKWLLFQSARGDGNQVFVRQYPSMTGVLRQVSSGDGSQPVWSKDGREIFYRSSSDSLVSVSVLGGAAFTVGAERALFSMSGVTNWDVMPDGRRFVLVRESAAAAAKRHVVVENFHEELKAKVPR
jgi:eukaryotic-like serine/threonine-protein kinase